MAPMNTDDLLHPGPSEAILGAAMSAHGKLKPGLHAKTDERALMKEPNKRRFARIGRNPFPSSTTPRSSIPRSLISLLPMP
jgi:hypothetical protein